MPLAVTPLHRSFGAELSGIDWARPLDHATVAAVQGAFREHRLLCLKAEPMAAAAFLALARHFGAPKVQVGDHLEDVPEVTVLDSTYRSASDKPDDMKKVRLTGWHTDDSYLQVPAKATMLQALAIPDSGGQTRFADTRAAWDDLPAADRARFEGLRAVHRYASSRAAVPATELSEAEAAALGEAVHPLVRRHDETGRKAIYVNSNRTERVLDMERAASDALLDELNEITTRPAYQFHHAWTVGDILLWDNRCLIHSVNMDFPVGQLRIHQRILLSGSVPV